MKTINEKNVSNANHKKMSEILHIVNKIKSGESTARKEVEDAIKRAKEDKSNAILEIISDRSLKRADEIDEKIKNGKDVGKLAGVPYLAKDNFLTYESKTTAASKILENFKAPIQATAIEKLEEEGAICIGKTNLDSFAHGGSTENSAFGVTSNAVNNEHVAGGSSGGSAVAVAKGIVTFALGSDTGGSIRQPSSFNGVVGYKPTYGMISRYGVVAMASSTDIVGPITRTVEDAKLLCEIMSGQDKKDSTVLYDYLIKEDFSNIAIETERLILKPISLEYEKEIFNEFNDNVTKWLTRGPNENIDKLRDYLIQAVKSVKNGTAFKLLITNKEGEFIGLGELKEPNSKTPEYGLWLKESVWGKGYGQEFVSSLHKWASKNLDIDYFIYRANKENKKSWRIAEDLIKEFGGELMSEDSEIVRGKNTITKKYKVMPEKINNRYKIGVISEFISDGVDESVKKVINGYSQKLKNNGHEVEIVDLPMIKYALPIYYIVVPAEISSNLARFDGIRYGKRNETAKTLAEVYGKSRDDGFVDENKRRIMTGSYVLSSGFFDAYYLQAQKARTLLIQEFEKLFEKYDFLIGPVSPSPAWKIGSIVDDPIKNYLADIMTVPASLAGLPAISIPAGENENHLPIGMQIIGPSKSDKKLLDFAKGVE